MNTIYYFTGTGNSLKLALDLKQKLGNTRLIAIKDHMDVEVSAEDEVVGFVFPVYFYGMPRIVHRFISGMDLAKASFIFAVPNGMYPDGIALQQIKEILETKQRALDYGQYIKMPTNYVSKYEAKSAKAAAAIYKKAEVKIEKIAENIMQNKVYIQKESMIYQMLVGAKKEYEIWAETVYKSDAEFIISANCDGCELCSKVCPVKNIEMQSHKPSFRHRCEQCYGCINVCPKKAIGYGKMRSSRYKHPEISLNQLIGS